MMSLLAVLALAAAGSPAEAALSKSDAGTSSADFLKLGVGARSVAMAGAVSGSVSDPTALSWNPAGLAFLSRYAVSTQYASYLGEASYQHLGFAMPSPAARGTLGFELLTMSLGSIARADAAGNDQGSFSPYNLAFAGGYARAVGPLRAGAAARFIQSRIVGSASTLALDLGARLSPLPGLQLGAALKHLGPGLKFGSRDPLPTTLQGGAAWQAREALLLAADVSFPRDNVPALHLGAEGRLYRTPVATLLWRAGYGTRGLDVPGIAGLGFGLGSAFEAKGARFGIDYAVAPAGELGVTHLISLSYSWGGAAAAARPKPAQPDRRAEARPARPAPIQAASPPQEERPGAPKRDAGKEPARKLPYWPAQPKAGDWMAPPVPEDRKQ